MAYDADGARLAVYDGEVRVAVSSEAATIAAGQEASLQRNGPITPLASAEEAPSRPALPTDLIVAPTPTPRANTPTATNTAPAVSADATLTPGVPAVEGAATPAEAWQLYTVQPNDTLSTIAAAHGLTWQELWEANRTTVPNPQVLMAGQTLRIPKSGDD